MLNVTIVMIYNWMYILEWLIMIKNICNIVNNLKRYENWCGKGKGEGWRG